MATKFNIPGFVRALIFLMVLLFLLVMSNYYDYGLYEMRASMSDVFPKMVVIFFLFILTNLVASAIKIVVIRREDREESFKIVRTLNFMRYGMWVVFFFLSASIIFEDFGALLTSFGLIGFGITFALQKPILNFVGWLNIEFNRTFRIGDRIRIGKYEGDVIEIKMMQTVVRGLMENIDQYSGKILTIPNELVLVEPVENYTKDDNFIKTELKVAITYESDWRKAKKIFEDIVSNVTKKNLHRHKKNLSRKLSIIDETIEKLSQRFEKTQKRRREKRLKEQISELEKQKEEIKESFEDMPSWFRPKIYLDMGDSSINLLALISVPYDMARTVKTEISMAFLDAIRKERNVEIAYPHLQLIMEKKPKAINRILTDFMGIDNISIKAEGESS